MRSNSLIGNLWGKLLVSLARPFQLRSPETMSEEHTDEDHIKPKEDGMNTFNRHTWNAHGGYRR